MTTFARPWGVAPTPPPDSVALEIVRELAGHVDGARTQVYVEVTSSARPRSASIVQKVWRSACAINRLLSRAASATRRRR